MHTPEGTFFKNECTRCGWAFLSPNYARVCPHCVAGNTALSLPKIAAVSETESDKPAAEPSNDVDRVIDQLDRRIVPDTDRGRLRGALDKADAPLGGKAGRDEAVGRAIRWGMND